MYYQTINANSEQYLKLCVNLVVTEVSCISRNKQLPPSIEFIPDFIVKVLGDLRNHS